MCGALPWAQGAAAESRWEETILAADTIVVLGDTVLEKPSDGADAARMLRLLSGQCHQVLTGICLLTSAAERLEVATTRVWFAALSEEEIAAYAASGEPMGQGGRVCHSGLASLSSSSALTGAILMLWGCRFRWFTGRRARCVARGWLD